MKYYELTKEEEKLLKEIESDTFTTVDKKSRQVYKDYARSTLNKTKNINLRIPERDLLKLKARAAEKGIPYQTLLASVIHQYSNTS